MFRSVLLAAAIGVAASTAQAASCGPRTDVLAALAKAYQEHPTAIGLSNSGRLLEIVTRADGGSWTLLLTSPQGVTCIVDAGGDWALKTLAKLDPEA
jgi:hypothetical protein